MWFSILLPHNDIVTYIGTLLGYTEQPILITSANVLFCMSWRK